MPTIDDGRRAIEEGNPQQARLIFEAILQENKRDEDAWLGLAEVLTDNEDKRVCYENVLKINKDNRAAREGLRNLEPQANPFVTALQPAAAESSAGDEDELTGDETIMSMRPPADDLLADEPVEGGPPTFALVALGLALSVVVFAVGGGIVFFLLTSLTG
ncbi:MAG: hypothetical protein D6768_09660 [Chloroflexi bacterium]|nr:MAG: hypothetical protein D6768_09660 [Chloroflexota bacterium]